MGGGYPHVDHHAARLAAHFEPKLHGGCECNLCGAYHGGVDRAAVVRAASRVAAAMPRSVELVYSGVEVGVEVVVGAPLARCTPPVDPCHQAFVDFAGTPGVGYFGWDPLTVLVAVRGAPAAGCSEARHGTSVLDAASGANRWVAGTDTNESYLVLHDAHGAAAAIDALLCDTPGREDESPVVRSPVAPIPAAAAA